MKRAKCLEIIVNNNFDLKIKHIFNISIKVCIKMLYEQLMYVGVYYYN